MHRAKLAQTQKQNKCLAWVATELDRIHSCIRTATGAPEKGWHLVDGPQTETSESHQCSTKLTKGHAKCQRANMRPGEEMKWNQGQRRPYEGVPAGQWSSGTHKTPSLATSRFCRLGSRPNKGTICSVVYFRGTLPTKKERGEQGHWGT